MMHPQQYQRQDHGNFIYDYPYASTTEGDVSNNLLDVIVTIEEPDDTSDLMLHLEDAHDDALFYHHYEYDPLLCFAEYCKDSMNNNNDNKEEESAEEELQMIQIQQGSFHKKNTTTSSIMHHSTLEPISEVEDEEEEFCNYV